MTKSPPWLMGYVESLDIQPLTSYRSDCPVCAKSNTFSVTDDGMQRLWYCFHADCNVRGRTGIKLTKEFASQALTKDKLTKRTPAPVVILLRNRPRSSVCHATQMQNCM